MKRIFMAAVKASILEILVYDEIGENYWTGGGITPATVAAAVKAAGVFDSITLRINSPGGSAFDGVAIYNLLRAQNKPIEVFVDGIAASAASVVAMAGDTINMGTGAMLMVHNAMWGCYGDAQALRAAAETIEGISVTIGEIYVKRTGLDATEVKAIMDAETWMGGVEAVEKGFATKTVDQSEDEVAEAQQLVRKFKVKAFRNLPAQFTQQEKPNANIDPDCECDCNACATVGCASCENDPCEVVGCDCPHHEEMSSEIIPSLEVCQRRLALRERAA
jgi:ATP-dependent Clp protease, protease subunit